MVQYCVGKKRLLLVMATGTGKTFTAFQIIHRLHKSGKMKKVLYLADRNVIYVNSDTGNDGNDGRAPERPKLTMQRSIWSVRCIWRYR